MLHQDIDIFLGVCKTNPSIQGVVITGSYGRGDNDLLSDLDIVVFLREAIEDFPEGKSVRGETQFDIRFVLLRDALSVSWSMPMFFAYLHGKIIYDPSGKIAKLLQKKSVEWEGRCFEFLCLLFASIGFIFPLSGTWRGLGGMTHFERFLKRGDLVSSQRLLSKTYESFLEAVYLINRQPCPDFKNMIRCLSMLSWVPNELRDHESFLTLMHGLSEKDLLERKQILDRIYEKIRLKAEQEFSLPKDIYSYHLTHRCVT